jgi:glutamate racemase
MNNGTMQPIAFFDSGVGGLPYLEVAKRLLPAERFIYLADRAGFPYGSKSADEVIALAARAVGALIARYEPKAVVVACNTASALALAELRKRYQPTPIVGTVPAVKPAALSSRAKRIGVVATARMAGDAYLSDLIERWAPDCQVLRRGDQALVDFVEHRLFSATRDERLAAVRPSVDAMLEAGVDAIVLGCTHFLYLAAEFAELAGPAVRIVDSRDGVAAQLRRVVNAGTPGAGSPPTAASAANARKPAATAASAAPAGKPAVAAAHHQEREHEPDIMLLSGAEPFDAKYSSFAARFGLRPEGSLYA